MEMALASGSGSDRFVTVHLGHAKTTDRILLEIHLDQNGGFVAHYPCVMARRDRNHLRRRELLRAAIGVLKMNPAACQESDMRVHAELGADDRFHVRRQRKPGAYTIRLTRPAPARTTSTSTPPTTRRWASFIGASSESGLIIFGLITLTSIGDVSGHPGMPGPRAVHSGFRPQRSASHTIHY